MCSALADPSVTFREALLTCDTQAFSEVEMGDGRAVCQESEQALVLKALTLGHIQVSECQTRRAPSSHSTVHRGHHRAAYRLAIERGLYRIYEQLS